MSVLFYVDTDAPNFGETSEDSIALGIEEAPHYGPTAYMTGIRQTFRDKKKALEYFHTLWPDRNFVETHLRGLWQDYAPQQIKTLYEDSV